ncbi:hypothetical protein PC116_g7440 [Phytophthora cactorum]|uniref:Uncharacterized protein n=1 Tax=Phytophthora cactorum TaxID=29920 RepID=A0A329SCV0_9STRA|nr:hypothetical protein Pcac1_g19724 [Phytophthora cactorum]KAG2920710.1 hypothetical protein PC114_g5976 [Phytophthora cactorum]KAG2945893.1 hypothetical protein PC117_g8067 [Phytophthora cactorum]KAG3024671.1 hypothetical protein PC120_g6942 [Phytophthora cactorum]KAG3031508.1 hypothetical protein PC119_g5896 [Phytophthora cactorum]
MYRDRHGVSLDEFDLESLHSEKISGLAQSEDQDSLESTMELTNDDTSVVSMAKETMADVTVDIDRDEACAMIGRDDQLPEEPIKFREASVAPSEASATDVDGITRALASEPTTPQRDQSVVTQRESCSEGAEQ